MATYLVTGANKGIGLQVCTQLAARGDEAIAVCRSSSVDLRDLGLRIIEEIDVSEAEAVARLKSELGDQKIDVLLNNAGILHGDSFGNLDYEDMVLQFRVNSLGPLRVTEALADNIVDGGKVGIVSSRVGSIADNGSGGYYGYRASKAAVNQIGMNLTHELRPRGIAVALLHPGMVATTMTGRKGIDPAEAASGLIDRIDELTLETSGHFWHAEGYELPW
jgi:NAD(P)-dependent dehydrogenase (short-subunit alcohol dehydrogenase family)